MRSCSRSDCRIVIRTLRLAVLLLGVFLAAPLAARAASCTTQPVSDRLAGADIAFVGRVVSQQPVQRANGIPQYDYTFSLSHGVKGSLPARVTVRSAKLVDLSGVALTPSFHEDVGVLATHGVGGALVTSACGVVDAVALLDAGDPPKGSGIKVLIGLVIAALVIGYSIRRLKKRDGAPRPNPLG
jgi:hypothetical protein